jgi:hypothetical protein
VAAIVAGASLAADARQQGVYRGRADIVVIDVSVSNGRTAIAGLTRDDFVLTDDGVPQAILDFAHGTLPLDVTLTLDISGSMTPAKRAAMERAVSQVSAALMPADRAAVVTFASSVAAAAPLRHPPIAISLGDTGRGTSVLDALLVSLVTTPVVGRRQISIVMTDADDTSSFFDARTVIDTAAYAPGVMSFVVVRDGGTRADGVVLGTFRAVARATGGEVIQIGQDDPLSRAFLAAIGNFRASYVLRYTPAGVSATGWHDVAVTVKSRKYDIRARRGYWALPSGPSGEGANRDVW